jgi:hypothetical protein
MTKQTSYNDAVSALDALDRACAELQTARKLLVSGNLVALEPVAPIIDKAYSFANNANVTLRGALRDYVNEIATQAEAVQQGDDEA